MRWMSCNNPVMGGNLVGSVISESRLPVHRLKTSSRSSPRTPNLLGWLWAMVMKAMSDHFADQRKSTIYLLVKLLVKQVCT